MGERLCFLLSCSTLALLLVAGCSSSSTPPDGSTDGSMDAPMDAPPDAPETDGDTHDAGDAGPADAGCFDPSPEFCDGEDDDCDGTVDEGIGEEIGCDPGEGCLDGSCGCPEDRMCGERCIDTSSDPEHCGSCGNACAEGDLCAAGECCTPTGPETCDGDDDDCDGAIDEGEGTTIGCSEAEMCVDGSCTCPDERTCGAACVDITSDPDNCGDCGTSCSASEVCDRGVCCEPTTNPVDMLFMVDNSNSMAEEQASLAEAFPSLIDILTSGDIDGDGTQDFPEITDLHVGVVTADMGTGGFRVPTCNDSDFGDDGILQTDGNTSISGCAATYPKFLSYSPGDSTADFADDFACVARLGTGGCGFEQQLEAGLKALTPSTSPITFFSDTRGHGDGENDGFLREDSLLGVVMVTDEDDCSASDPDIYNPDSTTYTGDLNLRCFQYREAQHPIERYVDGFTALRSDPSRLVFTAIVGVPTDLVTDPSSIDYADILSDPRMEERIDPDMPTRLEPSCNVVDRGLAFPPRRIVRTARDLEAAGASSVVQSICQADYGPALEAVATRLADGVVASCD